MASYVCASGDKVFDPAVGTGAFYEAVRRVAPARGDRLRFYGIDVDPDIVAEASVALRADGERCRLEQRDFILDPPEGPFSSIIANPPYIRHHRLTPELKDRLRSMSLRVSGIKLDGRAGLHVYFLIQALALLAKRGRLAFIMPADTCEGVFAPSLWRWITRTYRLDCVITFSPEATPFPEVDTNPVVFLIENAEPRERFIWVKCRVPGTNDLRRLVESDFNEHNSETLTMSRRYVTEGIKRGLSRDPTQMVVCSHTLGDFATAVRGIATGANDYFFLTEREALRRGLPADFLVPALGRTRDVRGDRVTNETMSELARAGRPTLLFSPDGRRMQDFPLPVKDYLKEGESSGLPRKPLIATRRPWYKMEKRRVPPFLFAYLGRRNARFIRNEAGIIPLTGFLCVYPRCNDAAFIERLWFILRHPDTLKNLPLVGKSYGSGALKVEPRALENLPIPDTVVEAAGFAKLLTRRDQVLFPELAVVARERPPAYKCDATHSRRAPDQAVSRKRGKPSTRNRKQERRK